MAPRAAASAVPCALVALAALGPPAWACLLCFTSYSERHRICRIFVGVEGLEVEKCEEAFSAAFEGLLDTEISEETRHLPPSSRALGGRGGGGGRGQRGLERPSKRETTDWQIGMGDRGSDRRPDRN